MKHQVKKIDRLEVIYKGPDGEVGQAYTNQIWDWMRALPDSKKSAYALNWRMPHSLFNVTCKCFPGGGKHIQRIAWYKIFKSRDMGTWGHGGPVICQSFA